MGAILAALAGGLCLCPSPGEQVGLQWVGPQAPHSVVIEAAFKPRGSPGAARLFPIRVERRELQAARHGVCPSTSHVTRHDTTQCEFKAEGANRTSHEPAPHTAWWSSPTVTHHTLKVNAGQEPTNHAQ